MTIRRKLTAEEIARAVDEALEDINEQDEYGLTPEDHKLLGEMKCASKTTATAVSAI